MTEPARDELDRVISRTTSEGRTQLDANELLRSDQARRTYDAFKKLEELTRRSSVTGSQYEKLHEQLTNVERLLEEAQKPNRLLAERERFQEAIDAIRGVAPRR